MRKATKKDNSLIEEHKEDLGLLLLMQQVDVTDTVSEDEVFDYLDHNSQSISICKEE